jgi:predicted NAD/FAD-binding protein
MPLKKATWSSWNYLRGNSDSSPITLSYWMNILQPFIPMKYPLFVTLNPEVEPSKDKTFAIIDYEHPKYLPKCVDAQSYLRSQNGLLEKGSNTYFGGAYCGFGFHEDGCVAGLRMAKALGSPSPSWDSSKDQQLLEVRYLPRPKDPNTSSSSSSSFNPWIWVLSTVVLLFALKSFNFF